LISCFQARLQLLWFSSVWCVRAVISYQVMHKFMSTSKMFSLTLKTSVWSGFDLNFRETNSNLDCKVPVKVRIHELKMSATEFSLSSTAVRPTVSPIFRGLTSRMNLLKVSPLRNRGPT
jgi:hypothetical protein